MTFKYTPTYAMLSVFDGLYTMVALDSKGVHIGTGTGQTKKQGEQLAAKNALLSLK